MSGFRIIALALALGWDATAEEWPQFLGPARDGACTVTNLAHTWPKEGPPVLWRKEAGQGLSGPAAAAGKVILFHRVADKETVECIDALTGKGLWLTDYPTSYRDQYVADQGPRATPAISSGRVYTCGAEGVLHCLDFGSGKKLWSVNTVKEFGARKSFFGIACSPLIEGKLLVIDVGGSKAGMVAFDSESGALRWKTAPAEASYSSPVAATIQGKRYIVFFTREGMLALDPTDGRVSCQFQWRPSIDASVNAATPLVIDDLIFISTSYSRGAALLRYAEPKPDVIWSGDEQLSNHYATTVHHKGFLYGYHGRQEQGCDLRCIEMKTGKVMWSVDRFGAGTISLVNDRLLLLTERGELIMAPASQSGFKPVLRSQILGLDTRAYPALANGLFLARDKRQLICVDLRAK